MNIIVIDDEPAPLLTFSSHIFDNANVTANMFTLQIDEALAFARDHVCKAVFLDINMPTVNGIVLAEKFIKISPEIKIIFITGYAQNIDQIKKKIGNNFYAFCYKPYDRVLLNNILTSLINDNTSIYFRTFPSFDCYVNDVLVDFSRAKSKELLALLVDRRGATVTMDEAISALWGDKKTDLSKQLYRDAVCRLRITLKKYHLLDLINVKRARIALNTQNCLCDMWDYIDGKNLSAFSGEYMCPYEWSTERKYYFESLKSV